MTSVTVSELVAGPEYITRSPTRTSVQGSVPKLKTRPSSPLLGERYHATSVASRSARDSKPRTLRERGSSSTLDSHYDAQKSPLSVSQQTSASAARDYTMKRGIMPVMPAPEQFSRPSSRRQSVHFNTLTGSAKRESTSKSDSKPRPRMLDLSTFFPKPATAKPPLLSPQRYTQSPSPFSEDSRTSAQVPPVIQINKLSKTPPINSHKPLMNPLTRKDPPLPKLNVRRPRKSIQNWFDGPEGNISEDEESAEEPALDPSSMMPPSPLSGDLSPIQSCRDSATDAHAPSNHLLLRPEAPPIPRRSPVRSLPAPLALNQNASPFSVQGDSPRNSNGRRGMATSVSSMSVSSRKSRDSTWKIANLQTESVLSMSSSDDDSENEIVRQVSKKPSAAYQSITQTSRRQVADRDAEPVHRLSLSSVQHPRLRDLNRASKNSLSDPQQSSRWSKSTDETVTSVENRASKPSKLSSRKSGQSRDSASVSRSLQLHELDSQSASIRNSMATFDSSLSRKPSTRMMPVTRQEEALLEAMRQTKARLRSDTISSTSETPAAILFDITEASPRQRSSSHRGDAFSLSEKRALQTSIYSSSSGSSAPTPDGYRYSQHGSVVPSESGPSPTTASRASPVTPPRSTLHEELPPLRVSTLRPMDPASMPFARHGRNQTGSSGIIMLDDADDSDEVRLEDFPMWALSGVDKASSGIAVV